MANSVMHHLEDSETLLGEEGPQDESNRGWNIIFVFMCTKVSVTYAYSRPGHDVHTRKDRLRSWMKRIAPAWIKDEVVTLLKLSAPIVSCCMEMTARLDTRK